MAQIKNVNKGRNSIEVSIDYSLPKEKINKIIYNKIQLNQWTNSCCMSINIL